jgi:hypothetical protein
LEIIMQQSSNASSNASSSASSNSALHTVLGFAREAGRNLLDAIAEFMRWLPEATLPRIAIMCVVLALVSSVLPLALGLFVLFVMLKFLLSTLNEQPKQSGAAQECPEAGTGEGQ